MAATQYVEPFVLAGAAAVVLAVTWVLRTALQQGIATIVRKEMAPLEKRVKRLERHRGHIHVVESEEEAE